MRSRQISLVFLCLLGLVPTVVGQDRPVPSTRQHYHKPHRYIPGVSITRPSFVHAPVFNDPMCCECQECKPQLGTTLKEYYETDLAPDVLFPPIFEKLVNYLGLNRRRLNFYGSVEAVAWSLNSPSVQPLVTTSPRTTDQTVAGVLGQPTTSTLFGGGDAFDDYRIGGRYNGAIVVTGASRWILEATYTTIGEDNVAFRADDSLAIVARPFFNSSNSTDDARLIVFPDLASGNINVEAGTTFDTFQLAFRRGMRAFGGNADFTIGYRKAQLDDFLEITDVTNSLSGATNGTRFEVRDSFQADNQFDGVDFGVVMRMSQTERMSLDLLAKAAFGRTESVVQIDGRTITRPPGGTRTGVEGGLLAQGTNIGRFRDSSFGTFFEVGATLKYRISQNVKATLGYTLLSWQDIARVSDQLDSAVNTSQFNGGVLDGDPRPRFRFSDSDLTAHGLRGGIEILF